MYLLELSLSELKQFLQLVLWISVPFTVVCLAIATFLHYRRRKIEMKYELSLPQEGDNISMSFPPAPLLNFKGGEQGHNNITRKYERQLQLSREKYFALEKTLNRTLEDYASLRSQFEENGENIENVELHTKMKGYELKMAQLQQALEYLEQNHMNLNKVSIETTSALEQKTGELKEMETGMVLLREAITQLNDENAQLRESLLEASNKSKMELLHDEHLQQLQEALSLAEEQSNGLKNSLKEMEYLHEVVKDKKLQIEFLQNQIENRIKDNYQLDHELARMAEKSGHLEQSLNLEREKALEFESNKLLKEKELEQMHGKLQEWYLEKDLIQQSINSRSETINQLENQLFEMREQTISLNNLNNSLKEENQQVSVLEGRLATSQQRGKEFEEKWEQNSRLISRIYRELAGSVDPEMAVSGSGAIHEIKEDHHQRAVVV